MDEEELEEVFLWVRGSGVGESRMGTGGTDIWT